MNKMLQVLLKAVLFLSVVASSAVAAPKREPISCPSFSGSQDALALSIDSKRLHVVSHDKVEIGMSSFPVFLVPGGPGFRYAIRTTERSGTSQIRINSGCGG
jgi:hypothetical protein